MEEVYPPNEFDCTEVVNWKEFFNVYIKDLRLARHPLVQFSHKKLKLKQLFTYLDVDLDFERMAQIESNCSADLLNIEGECSILPPGSKKLRKDHLKRNYLEKTCLTNLKTERAKVKWVHVTDLGIRRKFFFEPIIPTKTGGFLDIQPGRDIIFTVRVYCPFPYYDKKSVNLVDKVRCSFEMKILGSQTIENLKDKILCENDLGIYAEITDVESIDKIKSIKVTDQYPSSFIFIGNTFYYDISHPNAIDTSVCIREWAEKKGIGVFESKKMSEMKLEDCKFRIGYPYIYQHVADCEHIIIFCDVRVITKSDPLKKADYPYICSIHRSNTVNCNICDKSVAAFLILESDRLPSSKAHLCQTCFISYNFVDGKRVGNFKAYNYYDRAAVL